MAGVGATLPEFGDFHLDEDSDAESLVAEDDTLDAEPVITDQAEC